MALCDGCFAADCAKRSEEPTSCGKLLPRDLRVEDAPDCVATANGNWSRTVANPSGGCGSPAGRWPVPHLRRFILIGLYTGTRSQAILGLTWMPSTTSGWVDLEHGVSHRRGEDQKRTKKQQTPAALPRRLLAHLKRWHRLDTELGVAHVCHYHGTRVRKLRTSWVNARDGAGLSSDVIPHTLRHTAATWLMQRDVPMWVAAGFLGMTVKTLEETYGHHHPDFQRDIREAF